MRAYFLRRLLLIPPTLFGITLIVFAITRVVPGGPLERALMEIQMQGTEGQQGSSQIGGQDQALSEEQLEQLKAFYGFDKPWYEAYLSWVGNVLQGDLGNSTRYGAPVWELIVERLPISIFYGVATLMLTYAVCIPLGVVKAIRHRTHVDNASSVLIFAGYAVPGYALGVLLLLFFGFRLDWFPTSGFTSINFEDLSLFGKVMDILHHAVLPLICYMIGSFAFLTLLMKNNLMENLAADYVRTAISKGASFKRTVVKHALRNSLIPIATNFGQNISLFLTGSFLIETVFDINGFGLLGYTSILDRDYPIVMGILFISALMLLIGNILSDILVAIVDPRIRFS